MKIKIWAEWSALAKELTLASGPDDLSGWRITANQYGQFDVYETHDGTEDMYHGRYDTIQDAMETVSSWT